MVKLREYTEELELLEDQSLSFDKRFFDLLIYLLRENNNLTVKLELIEILSNLAFYSDEVCDYMMDVDILITLFNLLNYNHFKIVEKSLIIFGNIIINRENRFDYMIMNIPIEVRIRELLTSKTITYPDAVISNILWLLKNILLKINPMSYDKVNKISKNNLVL